MNKKQTFEEKLSNAFAAMRRGEDPLVAKQNYLCCTGCATSGIGALIEKSGKIGGCYYHQQNAEDISEGSVYLGFVSDEYWLLVTQKIVASCHQAGLRVEWNGKVDQKILVSSGADHDKA